MTKATDFIKFKLLSTFILPCLAPMVCISLYNYYQIKSQIITSTLSHVEALAKMKSAQVDRFYRGVGNELSTISSLPAIRNILVQDAAHQNMPLSKKVTKELVIEVLRQFTINKEFDEIYIFGIHGDELAYYTRGTEKTALTEKAISEGKTKTYLSDIYLSHNKNKSYLFTASMPIKDYNEKIVGVIVVEAMANSLFEHIQDYSGLGISGETLLGKKIGNEIIFLNPLRHDKNAALVRKAKIAGDTARPVIDGSIGKNGSGEAVDYRGEKVIAAWGYIPITGWGIVAKIDTDEALKPLIDARNNIVITAAILLIFGIGASLKMAINFMRPVEILEKSAHVDTLTGLPNRKLLMGLLEQVLNKARLKDTIVAVMFIDLDGFKGVNDTFGHDIGDLLLKSVGLRLTNCVRQSDTVARLGGDEFIVLLCGAQDISNIAKIANTIIQSISEEFKLNGHIANIGASMGISVFPKHGSNADDMLRKADEAMYEAKKAGKNNFKFAN
jgi:diguanylate cyclase (GGDEF)-like protein